MIEIDKIIWKIKATEQTLKDISISSGVPVTTIWRLVNKKNKTTPTYTTIKRLSDYFDGE
jgi:hypothetical protein